MMSSQALNNPLQQTFTFLSVYHVPCSRAFRWNKKTRRVCSWVVLFCPGHCYALVNPIFFLESEKSVFFESGLLKRRTECSELILKWIFFPSNLPEAWSTVIWTWPWKLALSLKAKLTELQSSYTYAQKFLTLGFRVLWT